MENKKLTQSELKELLHYDKDTGVFTWLVKRSNRVKIGHTAGTISTDLSGKSYIRIRIYGKAYTAHRLAFLYITGNFPEHEVDHISGCGIDNTWSNMREVNRLENNKNTRMRSNNTSGVCGVYWDKGRGKWAAYIGVDHKVKVLGRFSSMLDAVCARKSAEIERGFHKNHGTSRPL